MKAGMDGGSVLRKIPHALVCIGFAIACIAAGIALLSAAAPPAFADDDTLSATDQQCLGCHGTDGMEKKLTDGDTLALHVPGDLFAKSVHSPVGCTGCHTDVDLATHPPGDKVIDSKRSFSLTMTEICRGCHADKFDQWETSIHATLVRNGDPAAPICTDCHNPHAVIKDAATQIDQVPCQKCHTGIFAAYSGSMHAAYRRSSDKGYAPICSDCHSAHEVQPTSLGQGPEAACFGCHDGVLEAHQKWLPNAALHFQAVACPACHAPGAQRKVDLMLIDSQAEPRETEQIGVPLFNASAQSDGKGINAVTLWNLMQTLNRAGMGGKTILRGRLDVRTAPQAHQLADKSQALGDCQVCHRAGSDAFQSVSISLVGPDGRRVDYGANADVLNSAMSLESVSGFYAIGGTRVQFLDILLILAVLGGLAVPVGHLTLGWLFKHYASAQPHSGSGNRPAGGDGPRAA
jgi:hypothetical protein